MIQKFIISAIAIGSVYSLIALGFQITYSVSNTMNCSQGASMMLGTVICYVLNVTWEWHIAIAIPRSLNNLRCIWLTCRKIGSTTIRG